MRVKRVEGGGDNEGLQAMLIIGGSKSMIEV